MVQLPRPALNKQLFGICESDEPKLSQLRLSNLKLGLETEAQAWKLQEFNDLLFSEQEFREQLPQERHHCTFAFSSGIIYPGKPSRVTIFPLQVCIAVHFSSTLFLHQPHNSDFCAATTH